MKREEIISGLQMTMDLIQFDPGTGNVRPVYELNDLDKTTYLACKAAIEVLKAQNVTDTNVGNNGDTIYRQDAIDAMYKILHDYFWANDEELDAVITTLNDLPSAQPVVKDTNVPNNDDIISRHAVIDRAVTIPMFGRDVKMVAVSEIKNLPSAQPERTCVNCGRTVNNGGWYADGGTKCPIEEHYALPKDGYCHLWEKRNVTDDDYPERRTDG